MDGSQADGTKGQWPEIGTEEVPYEHRKKLFEGGEALEQAAQRGGGFPILGDTQGQIGWGSEQPD